ncbi:MAG: lysophospholipid acyltransferase family protein [Syntrophaceae bacterium]|nr:lysophospholipid acyltransferase family protein [Syntrophaceae bacterium]
MTTASIADILISGFGRIPLVARRKLFVALFRLFYHLSPRQRLIATYNLRRAFPEKPLDEIRRIVLGVYRNLGIVSAEFFTLPRLTRKNIGTLVEAEGLEHCKKALEKQKGVLLFGAHFSNWELEAVAVSLLIKPGLIIYRPLDSTLLDRLVWRVRSATGNRPLAKEHAMRSMLRSLKRNEILGIKIDQNVAWHEGVFVDYFGRPACTTDGLGILAIHTEAPVLPASLTRLPDGRYRFAIGPEVEISRTGDQDRDVLINTQRFTKVIEETVRRYPNQWLWVHQRWKTQRCQIQM